MPFKIITTVIHEGPPDMDERLIVETTVGKRICAVEQGPNGKRFYLVRQYWPQAVASAANTMVAELNRRGVAVDTKVIQAVIDERHPPIVGEKVRVRLFHLSDVQGIRTERLVLKGTVTGFTIP